MPCSERSAGKTAAVVLAAGYSRRLGRPKQTLVLGGETLLQRAVRVAEEADLAPVIVVTRPLEGVVAGPPGVLVLLNAEAAEGMASSVRLGVLAAQQAGAAGIAILTCDQPLLTAAHLRNLCAAPHRATASAYAGRVGVPAYIPQNMFEALLALRGDAGARMLLQGAATVLNETLALDIDTEDDLQRALQYFVQQ